MQRSKQQNPVSIMTTMAYEAPKKTLLLLKKYGIKAQNEADLEQKLTDLYFNGTDKLDIEMFMARNHPHKDWLIKRLKLEPQKTETKKENIVETDERKVECHDNNCFVHHPETASKMMQEKFSNASGEGQKPSSKLINNSDLTVIALFGIVAITIVALKNQKP